MGASNSKPVIRWSAAKNLWVSSTGEPVCQDHGHVTPCPHQKPGKKCPTTY